MNDAADPEGQTFGIVPPETAMRLSGLGLLGGVRDGSRGSTGGGSGTRGK
jgi:hypothetical protein